MKSNELVEVMQAAAWELGSWPEAAEMCHSLVAQLNNFPPDTDVEFAEVAPPTIDVTPPKGRLLSEVFADEG